MIIRKAALRVINEIVQQYLTFNLKYVTLRERNTGVRKIIHILFTELILE